MRELLFILKLLEEHQLQHDVFVIDGYVYLDDSNAAGLGKHLYSALMRKIEIVGVSKNAVSGISDNHALLRGVSKNSLYVTSTEELEEARKNISSMFGDFKIPVRLKRVDQLCREKPANNVTSNPIMSINHSKEYYLSFWHEVKERLMLAGKLDVPMLDKPDLYRNPTRLIFGASTHNYRCDGMSEEEIKLLEKEIGLPLPVNFRTYCAVCGIDSGGPDYGIFRKWIKTSIENIHIPCPLEPRKGIGFTLIDDEDGSELSGDEYSFKSDDVFKGTMEISTGGNPCISYLVVNGPTHGDVFDYTGDMLFYNGSFEAWYLRWLDATLVKLQSDEAREHFRKMSGPGTTRH